MAYREQPKLTYMLEGVVRPAWRRGTNHSLHSFGETAKQPSATIAYESRVHTRVHGLQHVLGQECAGDAQQRRQVNGPHASCCQLPHKLLLANKLADVATRLQELLVQSERTWAAIEKRKTS